MLYTLFPKFCTFTKLRMILYNYIAHEHFILRHYLSPVHRRFDRRKFSKKILEKNLYTPGSHRIPAPLAPTLYSLVFRGILQNTTENLVGPASFELATKKL